MKNLLDRSRILERLAVDAVGLHLSPVSIEQHVGAVLEVLAETYADYSDSEIRQLVDRLASDGRLPLDRLGRVLPGGSRSVVDLARVRRELAEHAARLEEFEAPRNRAEEAWSQKALLRHDLLTAAQERALGMRARRGDLQARNELVRCNARLAHHTAMRYRTQTTAGFDDEDLLQESLLGVIRAAEKFEPERGFKFSTYATWWIKQSARRGIANYARPIRLPVHVLDEMGEAIKAREMMADAEGCIPAGHEVAAAIGRSADVGRRLDELPLDFVSLDELPDNGAAIRETQGAVDEPIVRYLDREMVRGLIATLKEPDRTVVCRRFALTSEGEATLAELGRELGITRERVRQIQDRALEGLEPRVRALAG